MDKIKILIVTDSAGIHSGLAETTRNIFIPLIRRYPDKYEIHQLGFFHFAPKEPVPWPIYQTRINQTPQGPQPDMADKYGEHSFHDLVQRVKPDIVFGYGDMWHFDHLLTSPMRNTYRMVAYYTIDGQPYYGHLHADGTTEWGKKLSKTDRLVVLSHFGKKTLERALPEIKGKQIDVRYHPLDMSRFRPLEIHEKIEMRKKMLPSNIDPTSFFIGWMGRNQFRKQNFKLWETLHYLVYGDYIECNNCNRITAKEWDHSGRKQLDPSELTLYDAGYDYSVCWHCKSNSITPGKPIDDIHMWLHMPKNDPGYNPDLHERIWNVGHKCIYSSATDNGGNTLQQVAAIQSVWDMMYYPSGGEGFGNPPFETMANAIPIVFSNYSSHAEFCKFGGLPVRVTYQPEIHHGIMRSTVDTNHAIEQILKLYRNRDLAKLLGQRGRAFVSQFDCNVLAPTWDTVFTEMMKEPVPSMGQKIYSTVI
jgi:glycosyltransferase involved in cell wall biosynthesis